MTKPADDDWTRAASALLWCRANGFAAQTIEVGSVRLVGVVDLQAMAASAPRGPAWSRPTEDDARNLYRQFGGGLLDRLERESDEDSTYEEDDDEEPAMPRGATKERPTPAPRRRRAKRSRG